MNSQTKAIQDDVSTLVEDARALFHATKDATEDKIVEARNRLASALDNGQSTLASVREKTMETAKAAEKTARENLYTTIGIAFGAGTLFGGLLVLRK